MGRSLTCEVGGQREGPFWAVGPSGVAAGWAEGKEARTLSLAGGSCGGLPSFSLSPAGKWFLLPTDG